MGIKEKFLRGLDTFRLRGGVLVALSGGADSVCLLDLFMSAKEAGLFPYPIAAAHLNHMLRGEEAERDAKFCKALCEKYGINLTVSSVDVAAFAKQRNKSVEEAAREIRYSFLQSTLENSDGIEYIATAHHRGDMCETMVLNLARGASLDGLCSIPRERGRIIRPLLNASREEILAYNNEKGLEFVTDATNSDTKYSRNRVRLNILPEFEKLYSGYEENLERTAKLLKRDADYLNDEAARHYIECVENGVLHTKKAQNIHASLLSRMIKRLYNYHGFVDITEAYIDALLGKIKDGDENFMLSLHGCTAVCERGKLTFVASVKECEDFCFDIAIGESVTLPNGQTVTLSREKCEGAYPLKASALSEKLTLRSRKKGDTVKIFGKTHKIKRIISDKKLSAAQKANLFFLCNDGEIIYSNIPIVADKAFVRKGENDCIFITVKD